MENRRSCANLIEIKRKKFDFFIFCYLLVFYEMTSVYTTNPTMNTNAYDMESGSNSPYEDITIKKFGSISARHHFVQKVFCNLTVMLTLTGLSCYAFMTHPNLKEFSESQRGLHLQYACIAILFGTVFAVICCDRIAKQFPQDYGILTLFTLAQSYLLGSVCNRYSPNVVILAGSATLGITMALTLFAFQTKYDCTGAAGFLFGALCGLIIVNIVNIFVKSSDLQLIASCAGVLIWTAYIVVDVQMIVGGKHHKYQFEEDEHVFATINLYLDIVNLFVTLLKLIDGDNDN